MSKSTTNTQNDIKLPNNASRLWAEAKWLCFVVLTIFLCMLLFSYSNTDSCWSHASSATNVHNWGGRLGAWIADVLLFVFGFSAWWFVAYLFQRVCFYTRCISRLLHFQPEPTVYFWRNTVLRNVGFLIVLISSSTLEHLRMYNTLIALPDLPGGVIGTFFGTLANYYLGFTASTLLMLLLILTGFSFFTQLSWLAIAEGIGTCIEFIYFGFLRMHETHVDRKIGQAATLKRDESISLEKEKEKDQPPVHIEPSVFVSKPTVHQPTVEEAVTPAENTAVSVVQNPSPIDIQTNTEDEQNIFPPLSLLDAVEEQPETVDVKTLEFTSRLIEKKLSDFGVSVRVVAAYPGPVVTRYEIEPATGVKGNTIVNLARDLARSLSLVSIRVIETIPGKTYMGLELPNTKRQIVHLTEILGSEIYTQAQSNLTVALGKDIAGKPVIADLAKMPHLLVAGTTGSGKSVGINATIISLLYKATAEQVRLILIDPKMLELSIYEGIPHLLAPVVTDMSKAGHALNWAVAEMEKRYKLMSSMGVRNLASYNAHIAQADEKGEKIPNPFTLTPDAPEPLEKLPQIVIVIDEFADLMMVVGKKVEELIARIAQKARAAGIHLILATQRPSVDVITGLIKANIPTRIAFQVSSKIDSRTILDQTGAETLLGLGDMLYLPPGTGLPIRVHGAFVSDDEVHRVVTFLKQKGTANYVEGILDGSAELDNDGATNGGEQHDELYDQAVEIVLQNRRASISLVQRHLRIGYNRAARLLEQMQASGLVSAMQSNGNREILVPDNR